MLPKTQVEKSIDVCFSAEDGNIIHVDSLKLIHAMIYGCWSERRFKRLAVCFRKKKHKIC